MNFSFVKSCAICHLSLLFAQTLLPIASYGAPITEQLAFYPYLLERDDVQQIIAETEIPEYLFHWTSGGEVPKEGFPSYHSRLSSPFLHPLVKREPSELVVDNQVRLPKKENSIYDPHTKARSLLYTWSHPMTGMGHYGGVGHYDGEQYARIFPSGRVSKLVVMKPKRDARFAIYVSEAKGWVSEDTKVSEQIDIVLHIRVNKKSKIQWIEWVVQNEESIEWASIYEEDVRPIVRRYLSDFSLESLPDSSFHSFETRFVPENWKEILDASLGNLFPEFREKYWFSCPGLLTGP
ncbi:MAG: hypothetical protein AAF202_05225 [Pseudomonadota bacterium]